MNLDDKVELVKNDILDRFPGCSYTITILLWDDETDLVECRYGDGNTIHRSIYYDNQLSFEEITQDDQVMIIDKFGIPQLKYLTDKPNG